LRLLIAILSVCLAAAHGQDSGADTLTNLRKILDANPEKSLAHFELGIVYLRARNYQQAATEFAAATVGDHQPAWVEPQAHLYLGWIFDFNGERERALGEYQEAQAPMVADAVILQKTEPAYSAEARIAGLEGRVLLTGVIDGAGLMREPHVTEPLGLGLDDKALDAVKQWLFVADGIEVGPRPFVRTVEVDFRLPEKLSRWHLVRAEFRPPAETSRPEFATTKYPSGTGISSNSLDEGRILGAIGRLGEVTLDLDIDEHGTPVHIQVRNASPTQWGGEAIELVRQWRFKPGRLKPGVQGGIPAAVRATLGLVWGPRSLGPSTLIQPPPPGTAMGRPAILFAPPPDYPDDARQEGMRGTVVVSLIVDEQGVPGELRVSRSLDPRLDRKALEAVAAWRFQPTSLNGQPVSVPTSVEVSFGLPKR